MPELVPKTALDDEDSSEEKDYKKDDEEEELNWNSDNEDQIPEFWSTYRDEFGRQVKLEQELLIK